MTERITRRGFFAAFWRGAAFAGLGAIVARLAGRSGRAGSPSGDAALCGRCPALGYCVLPDGAKTRRARGVDARESSGIPAGGASLSDGRGLCGLRPPESPGSTWTRREMT